MSDKVFLDTNVLVYAHTDLDLKKQGLAQNLMLSGTTVISTQVLQELANTLHRKFKVSWSQISVVLSEVAANNFVYVNSESTIMNGCLIADRYGFSFYDSLIISSAIAANCSVLYSEDLQNNQVIAGTIAVVNPFH